MKKMIIMFAYLMVVIFDVNGQHNHNRRILPKQDISITGDRFVITVDTEDVYNIPKLYDIKPENRYRCGYVEISKDVIKSLKGAKLILAKWSKISDDNGVEYHTKEINSLILPNCNFIYRRINNHDFLQIRKRLCSERYNSNCFIFSQRGLDELIEACEKAYVVRDSIIHERIKEKEEKLCIDNLYN